jgi:hypothetical protein
MKLNRREIVLLLNALLVQQSHFHKEDENAPNGGDFTHFEDGVVLVQEEQEENPYVRYSEYNDLFSKLVFKGLNDLTPEEEELFNLPPTEVQ